MGMGRKSLWVKGLFGGVVVLGFMWLLLVGVVMEVLESEEIGQGTKNGNFVKSEGFGGNYVKHVEELERKKKYDVHHELDLNYMSKRRVPNGPDPIHNRRAGNSKRPPGRA